MIEIEQRPHGIVWVTFARPEARNAMTFAMWERLREIAGELDADPAVRVVVFTGSGTRAFVAGTDISEFLAFKSADDGVAYERRVSAVISAVERMRMPTIAAIGGACTGGGVSIAAACDLRIGTPSARIGIPVGRTLGNYVALRNVARLASIIGLDAAKRLLLTAQLLDARGAREAGFLSEIVDDEAALAPRAQELAESIAALAPVTLRATKEAALRIRDAVPLPPDEDLVRAAYGSDDFREGVQAFLAKRPAKWSGR